MPSALFLRGRGGRGRGARGLGPTAPAGGGGGTPAVAHFFLSPGICALLLLLALAAPASALRHAEADRMLAAAEAAAREAAGSGGEFAFPDPRLVNADRIEYPDGRSARIDLSHLEEAAREIAGNPDPATRRRLSEILAATLAAAREELSPDAGPRKDPDAVRDALERTLSRLRPVPVGFNDGGPRDPFDDQVTDADLAGDIVATRVVDGTPGGGGSGAPGGATSGAGGSASPGGSAGAGSSSAPGGARPGGGASGEPGRGSGPAARRDGGGAKMPAAPPKPQREPPKPRPKPSGGFLDWLSRLIKALVGFLFAHLLESAIAGGVMALLVAGWFAWRSLARDSRADRAAEEAGRAAEALRRADAAALRAEALRLARAGDRRGAVRVYLQALLSLLDDRRVVRFDPALTNGEYLDLLRERAACRESMREPLGRFDAVVYGGREADDADVAAFDAAFRRIEGAGA